MSPRTLHAYPKEAIACPTGQLPNGHSILRRHSMSCAVLATAPRGKDLAERVSSRFNIAIGILAHILDTRIRTDFVSTCSACLLTLSTLSKTLAYCGGIAR